MTGMRTVEHVGTHGPDVVAGRTGRVPVVDGKSGARLDAGLAMRRRVDDADGRKGLHRAVPLDVVEETDARALTGVARVRLGGGLGLAPVMVDAVERALRELPPLFVPALEPARLGADAGLIGVGWWVEAHGAVGAGEA